MVEGVQKQNFTFDPMSFIQTSFWYHFNNKYFILDERTNLFSLPYHNPVVNRF